MPSRLDSVCARACSAPTSGGKTLVAEVLMIRNIMHQRRKVLFVVPYVSIVTEKVRRVLSSDLRSVSIDRSFSLAHLLFFRWHHTIAQEKYFKQVLSTGAKRTAIRVRAFHGDTGGSSIPKEVDVAICTIEKANSLLNGMLESGTFAQLGMVVGALLCCCHDWPCLG